VALQWTTTTDVTARWIGGSIPATDAQLTTLLEDAEDLILAEFPDIATRIARAAGTDTSEGPSVPQSRVQRVAARVVIRHLRNPEGIRSTQDGAGPFQRTKTFGGDEPGALWLTDQDRKDLGGAPKHGAFQIDQTPSDVSTASANPLDSWQTASG
jgi:hypothetical protein